MSVRWRRLTATAIVAIVSLGVLTGCTPGESVAYNVTKTSVDVAFCESLSAAVVTVDYSNYPPPFMGPKYTIAFQSLSGHTAEFGAGRPVSLSAARWTLSPTSDNVPAKWERVDYTFYDENGTWVGATFLFSRDTVATGWAWTEGYNVSGPRCVLNLG